MICRNRLGGGDASSRRCRMVAISTGDLSKQRYLGSYGQLSAAAQPAQMQRTIQQLHDKFATIKSSKYCTDAKLNALIHSVIPSVLYPLTWTSWSMVDP